jgi:hypothetical protein
VKPSNPDSGIKQCQCSTDGTITYGSSAATGNVTVKINKQNGTEQTVTISVTVPAHAADYKLTVPNFSIASQSIPNGETKTIQLQAAGSKLVVNGTEQADAAITYSYEEVGNSGLATITGSQLVLSPPATGSSATVTIKAIASWAGNGKVLLPAESYRLQSAIRGILHANV